MIWRPQIHIWQIIITETESQCVGRLRITSTDKRVIVSIISNDGEWLRGERSIHCTSWPYRGHVTSHLWLLTSRSHILRLIVRATLTASGFLHRKLKISELYAAGKAEVLRCNANGCRFIILGADWGRPWLSPLCMLWISHLRTKKVYSFIKVYLVFELSK